MMAHLHCKPDFDHDIIGHLLYWNGKLEGDIEKIEQDKARRASMAQRSPKR